MKDDSQKLESVAEEARRLVGAWESLSGPARAEIARDNPREFAASLEGLRAAVAGTKPGAVAKGARGVLRAWRALSEDDRDAVSAEYLDVAASVVGLEAILRPADYNRSLARLGEPAK